MQRCQPKAEPLFLNDTESAINASLGADLISLPVRSSPRANKTSVQLEASDKGFRNRAQQISDDHKRFSFLNSI